MRSSMPNSTQQIGQPQGGTGFFVTELRVVSRSQRRAMIDREEPKLSLVLAPCALLGISRSSLYYPQPRPAHERLGAWWPS